MANKYAKARKREDKESQVLVLHYEMLKHAKFRKLSGSAVKVLIGLCVKHSGFNNRKIVCSHSDLVNSLGLGKATINKALKDLIETGFIQIVKKGYFTGRMATEWEITFLRSEVYSPTEIWKDPEQRPQRPHLAKVKRDPIQQVVHDLELEK